MVRNSQSELTVYLVAGEESGDRLGASMMQGLSTLMPNKIEFAGVGGDQMSAHGLNSIFPISDIAVMGLTAVIRKLPMLRKRIEQTVASIVVSKPDVLVIIDSPDFTHRVAKRVRKKLPQLPIINYVSPSVWAWRPGRAKSMKNYIDQVLAILPFEPEVYKKLAGPECKYVGHPLLNQLDKLRPQSENERLSINHAEKLTLLVLLGSRRGEIERHLEPFGNIVGAVKEWIPNLEIILPTLNSFKSLIQSRVESWPIPVKIVSGEEEKYRMFRQAHGALAVSGTVSLELALAGVPMVVAYRADWLLSFFYAIHKIKPLGMVDSFALPNIILKDKVIPEFFNRSVNARTIAPMLVELLSDSSLRYVQQHAFSKLYSTMQISNESDQSTQVAQLVLDRVS